MSVHGRKRKTATKRGRICQDKGVIISLTGGKERCEKTLFPSTKHFQSDPWRELLSESGGGGPLNDFQSHFGTAQSLSAVYTEHFKTYH